MDLKKEKYIKIILYIISRCTHKDNLGKTVISVLLYFIDFNYYELYGESLTNEIYSKSRIGIVPKHFNEVMNHLIRSHNLYYRREVYYYYIIKHEEAYTDLAGSLFAGVNNSLALKKRYRDLLKIFHPDNLCGDSDMVTVITREYERLKSEIDFYRSAK